MNVGIIGSGGREHAICYMLCKSKKVSKIFCFPGNAGTSSIAQNVYLDPDNFSELEKHCIEKEIKLLVVGPEKPLVKGIVDGLGGKIKVESEENVRTIFTFEIPKKHPYHLLLSS